jgi:hypothetical protein
MLVGDTLKIFRSRVTAAGPWICFPVFLVILAISALAAGVSHGSRSVASLFNLSNFVGPTTQSLLQGNGLTVCSEGMGTPGNPVCFHAGRMPIPSLAVAAGVELLGDRPQPVTLFKTILFLLPIFACIALVVRRLRWDSWGISTVSLLLLPFLLQPFLADAVNLQVEEGYTYSLLPLAFALLLFSDFRRPSLFRTVLLAVSTSCIYLAKSSMAPAALVLLIAALILERRLPSRLLLLLFTLAAPVGWAIHQHHASGRYALGTSLDGINFHKGNNPAFLSRYPPPPGHNLDEYDVELNAGHTFSDEWSFNDFHQRAALDFIAHHPAQDVAALLRKTDAFFFTLRKLGSGEEQGIRLIVETAGILVLRLLLWAAIFASMVGILRRRPWRFAGVVFLALVAAVALPYLAGFAYTRHASVLIYPSVLLCAAVLLGESRAHAPSRLPTRE